MLQFMKTTEKQIEAIKDLKAAMRTVPGLAKDVGDLVRNQDELNARLAGASPSDDFKHATVEGLSATITGLELAIANKMGRRDFERIYIPLSTKRAMLG